MHVNLIIEFSMKNICCLTLFLTLFGLSNLHAQITVPPSGDNQRSVVTQYMGLVSVSIDYNSPDVHKPDGTDRKGNIWGKVVPYGVNNLGFGWSSDEFPSPWRAGANENSTISFSHDVLIEGQALKAGKYGLHMIPGEKDWVVIFSNNSSAWGSYYYKETEDALRVTVEAASCEYNEWLTYEFTDRKLNGCTAELKWELLKVPFRIEVPNIHELYLAQIRDELRGQKGFMWQSYTTAANYCVKNKVNLEEALKWADMAISGSFVGTKNFSTLSTKANVLNALSRFDEANIVMDEAIKLPNASVFKIHAYGRQLIKNGKKNKALDVFKYNAKKYPNTWPVNFGLCRGYSAIGKYKTALKYAKLALKNVPDQFNKNHIEKSIVRLEKGEDIN